MTISKEILNLTPQEQELMYDIGQEPEVNEGQEPIEEQELALVHEGETLPEQRDRNIRGRGALPKFKSVPELQRKINEYFDKNRILEKDEKTGTEKYVYINPLTINGLSNHLGFFDRGNLLDYAEKNEFAPLIKKARAIIFQYVEDMLLTSKYPTAYIFWLKANADWRDTPPPSQDPTLINSPVSINYGLPTNNKDDIKPLNFNTIKSRGIPPFPKDHI